MENYFNEMIMEKATKLNVKVKGLKTIPTIIQGRPLFDFAGVDETILKQFGQDPEDMFAPSGRFNIALHPDGRVEGLKIVSDQYKVVQHNEAIWKLFEALPEMYGTDTLDIFTSKDGGNCVAYFKGKNGLEIAPGDVIYPRTCMKNSANATIRFMVKSAMWRQICSNGMMGPDKRFAQISSRKLHKGSLDLDTEVSKYIVGIENDIDSMGLWKQYAVKSLKSPDIDSIFEMLEIGPRVQEELLALPLRGKATTVKTLLESNSLTGWDFYNSFTQRITDSDSDETVKIENGIKVSNAFDSYLEIAA